VPPADLTEYEQGLIVGVLVGDGHFGGDGRKAQVTLRMHVRHEHLLRWLQERLPRSRLYGPYDHGDRHYFQWMMRGRALSEDLLPLLERAVHPSSTPTCASGWRRCASGIRPHSVPGPPRRA
jgi:hypothetical protein